MSRDITCLPEYVQTGYHTDWFPKWLGGMIPRRWTAFCWPLPARKIMGNQKEEWIQVQSGYPLSKYAQIKEIQGVKYALACHPVPPRIDGRFGLVWSLQAIDTPGLGSLPFFTCNFKLFGKGFHVNFGAKPDYTIKDEFVGKWPNKGDWFVAFPEASFGAL